MQPLLSSELLHVVSCARDLTGETTIFHPGNIVGIFTRRQVRRRPSHARFLGISIFYYENCLHAPTHVSIYVAMPKPYACDSSHNQCHIDVCKFRC